MTPSKARYIGQGFLVSTPALFLTLHFPHQKHTWNHLISLFFPSNHGILPNHRSITDDQHPCYPSSVSEDNERIK